MTKRHADDVTVADIVRLRKENEELQQRIRYQEHRDGAAKGKTHSIDCYGYGPSHYECALQEIERLQEALHRISLGSQDSGTTKESLGKESRAALKEGE